MEKKPLKITFAPGCFDSFEGTQEELESFQAELVKMFETGEFLEKAEPIDLDALDEEDPEHANFIRELILADVPKRTLQ
jgi:hypothetical protein